MNANKLRIKLKRARPAFKRPNWHLKRVGPSWRKPKGMQSKLRQHQKDHGWLPNTGYGSPLAARGFHPSGLREVFVTNAEQLNGLDPKSVALRIGGTVGKLKRNSIQEAAKAVGLTVLNPKKFVLRQKTKAAAKTEKK